MVPPDQYDLLDFGDGRRLERFGGVVLDRPCPAAEGVPRAMPELWRQADARFERGEEEEGRWSVAKATLPEQWTVAHGPLRFELKRTPFGHVGLFPEQAENWEWIAGQAGQADRGAGCQPASASQADWQSAPRPAGWKPALRVLNLFAYTGGSTLAAAAGAEVVHVDAARNIVAWARRNAELSGLAGRPIHWIAEDAQKFVRRELRRGSRYDAVILDPPSYGHGLRGEVWRLSEHLPRLLAQCAELTAGRRRFMLLTCHTPGYEPERLREMLAAALGDSERGAIEARQMVLRTAAGRELPSGVAVYWKRP
jgi:23S rRNA (cytosine1962-C5)-methyltransferase